MRTATMLAAAPCLLFVAALGACATPAPPPVAPHPAAESAADACLRTASAKRERRANEPAKVGVKHVLVKYAGAKNADSSITLTRGQACLRALEVRDRLRGGADFAAMVTEYSDEPGAASREGSLGLVERGELVPSFADAAFELDARQLSDVVETPFGFHVVLRSE